MTSPSVTVTEALTQVSAEADERGGGPSKGDVKVAARPCGDGLLEINLCVPDIRCGACVQTIERTLGALDGVIKARANLTTKQVRVVWDAAREVPAVGEALAATGFATTISDAGALHVDDGELVRLIRALAVSGFAAGNIMMLSLSIWSGADETTRTLFHYISAAIALPAIAYAGQVFFRSAWTALRARRINMDVPISVGVLLACALSTYDTFSHADQVYFDAAVMLVFLLLIGRTLDCRMRRKVRNAADALSRLEPRGARVLHADGQAVFTALEDIAAGDYILIGPNARIPVDCQIDQGRSAVDRSLVTGESTPEDVAAGSVLQAGVLNITGSLRVIATADAQHSFVADVRRLVENAEISHGHYQQAADRAAALYAPVVHIAALLVSSAWYLSTGDVHHALTIGIAVLIITCPCALGLAVPSVQVIAARRLFERGVLLRDSAALERLAAVDCVVFDKTGTLTTGQSKLANGLEYEATLRSIALSLAQHSSHPHARALTAALVSQPDLKNQAFERITEVPGAGIEAVNGTTVYRLGRTDWATFEDGSASPAPRSVKPEPGGGTPVDGAMKPQAHTDDAQPTANSTTVLTVDGVSKVVFQFNDTLRPGAKACVEALTRQVGPVSLLSGDQVAAVTRVASTLGITHARAQVLPKEKVEHVQRLLAQGHTVLMVGDGLNDSPALAAASVSFAPGSASDVGRATADFIFLQTALTAIPYAICVARRARRLVRQNLFLALAYNLCALPVAAAGMVTPLVAAVSMSLSSLLVIANTLRLAHVTGEEREIDFSPSDAPEMPNFVELRRADV